jgi:predicted anti-sigma-YlaC factor YlaD
MTCEETQEWILEFGSPDAAVDGHLSHCETCRGFLALQRSLDEQLTRAYTAPPLDDHFRVPIHARIKTEKWRHLWDVLPALIALGTALITSGLCALLAPELAGYAFASALALSIASYMGQILFTWLTEELGEG